MNGTLVGNIISIIYYLYFQLAGFVIISFFFRKENLLHKLLMGSVAGSLLLTWLPILLAFQFDFTVLAHILAVIVPLPVLFYILFKSCKGHRRDRISLLGAKSSAPADLSHRARSLTPDSNGFTAPGTGLSFIKEHLLFILSLGLLMIVWLYLLHTHTILPGENGDIRTGQCGYGDMNMHLGFITSLAVQQTFPPDYSIMPGVKLSYPFLSDSISSSLYLLGASLRVAYIIPMVFALAQIFTTVYAFANTLFGSLRKSMLVLVLFFLNGGLGFAYFINWSETQTYRFSDIFTGFYTTPTNLIEENIRWVNVIADMFLPQRATLFGYAVLFPTLWLLYRAVFKEHKELFLPAGLFASALPMIHTHSFLSAGIISAVWLLLWLMQQTGWRISKHPQQASARNKMIKSNKKDTPASDTSGETSYLAPGILAAFIIIMCLLQRAKNTGTLTSEILILLGISLFIAAVIYGVILLFKYIKSNDIKTLLTTWGLYLLCVVILAVPQLLFWTFGQVSEGGFVRGHFNWGNLGDPYPWFYLKNIGAPLLLILGSICACTGDSARKKAPLYLPVLFLWWLGELIVFTPNTYDNNKLLYVAYLLLCFGAADYGVELYDKLKDFPGRKLFAGIFLFASVFSGILTLGREAVSEYQLYGPSQVALVEYIEENTETDAVFLTNTHHNNAIPSLTGRNIVCGADTFLYFHGVDTTQRKADLKLMFEAPLENRALYKQYQVDYIVISSFEKNNYHIDESVFANNFTEVFSYGDVTLYQVN